MCCASAYESMWLIMILVLLLLLPIIVRTFPIENRAHSELFGTSNSHRWVLVLHRDQLLPLWHPPQCHVTSVSSHVSSCQLIHERFMCPVCFESTCAWAFRLGTGASQLALSWNGRHTSGGSRHEATIRHYCVPKKRCCCMLLLVFLGYTNAGAQWIYYSHDSDKQMSPYQWA